MMFVGTKEYSVDEKGRVVLPPKYRDDLAGEIMIFKDIVYDCIRVYPYTEYEKYIAELDNEILSDRNAEILLDRAISRAESVQLDKQGRIMIPQKMRDSIGIDKEVLVIGKRTRFEVWTKAAYDAEFNDDREALRAYEDRIKANKEMKLKG